MSKASEQIRQAGRAAAAVIEAQADDVRARTPRLGGLFKVFEPANRPDKSWEGFRDAAKLAIDACERIDWISAEDMCERVEHEMATLLRLKAAERGDTYTGLRINFVGCDRRTRTPQFRIECDWGWRLDVAGLISFSLAKPLQR